MAPLRRLLDEYLGPDHDGRVSQELRCRLEGIARLLDVTRLLAAEIDPTQILETITQVACTALRCERASLYQYDPLRNELYTSVVTRLEIAEIRRSLEHGITGYAARHRQVINVADPPSDPRWNAEVDKATGFHTRNILAAPLIAPSGALLGVLQLLNRQGQSFDETDEELLSAFSQHAAVALDRARLVQELQHQQAMRASLDVAREIQRGFMPHALPKIPGYEAATWWLPNQAVGGDYCDVFPLKDQRVALVIADVSGHGLGPSLLMASVRAALRALVIEHAEPEVLLNLLGRSLAADLADSRFITMVLAALDWKDHSVQYANAGHAPALHYQAATGEFFPLESTGMPLGVQAMPEYSQGWPIELEAGDLLVLATDGIVEAMDANDRQFGVKRLQELIAAAARRPVKEIVGQVGSEVESHYHGTGPPDDLTILALRRNG